ncbi:MAG TPA: fatty acid desaturase [Pyrinomonadaceae bacterium]|jgi:stearoyl-CoA desaturase (delta-9 desaturase)|nr:fatty acid desaturase [Pyrinomonadaceae bacterium]
MQTKQYNETRKTKWGNLIFLAVAHVAAIAAPFFWSWSGLVSAIIFYWVAGSLGIGMGYHRLITHRGYRVPKLIEYFLVTCGTLAVEGGPIQWVVTHRIHHAHTDQNGDPHTPRDGGWWAHIGWILRGTAQDHDRVTIDRYAPDLISDRYYRWLNRLFFVPLIVLGVLLLLFGGWSVLLWAVALRVTLALHATWLVNSATHMWGRRRFETGENSRNSWWVALLTFAEGWDNNHHAYPTSGRHGLRWYEIDFNWFGVRTLQLVGLASAVKRVRFNRTTLAWKLGRNRGWTKRLHRAEVGS